MKSQLDASAKKLKQAQEEGGQIRADMKLMIQKYQVHLGCSVCVCVCVCVCGKVDLQVLYFKKHYEPPRG